MLVYGFVDEKQIKREKQKARELRRTAWWKQKLACGQCYYCGQRFPGEELTMDHKLALVPRRDQLQRERGGLL